MGSLPTMACSLKSFVNRFDAFMGQHRRAWGGKFRLALIRGTGGAVFSASQHMLSELSLPMGLDSFLRFLASRAGLGFVV